MCVVNHSYFRKYIAANLNHSKISYFTFVFDARLIASAPGLHFETVYECVVWRGRNREQGRGGLVEFRLVFVWWFHWFAIFWAIKIMYRSENGHVSVETESENVGVSQCVDVRLVGVTESEVEERCGADEMSVVEERHGGEKRHGGKRRRGGEERSGVEDRCGGEERSRVEERHGGESRHGGKRRHGEKRRHGGEERSGVEESSGVEERSVVEERRGGERRREREERRVVEERHGGERRRGGEDWCGVKPRHGRECGGVVEREHGKERRHVAPPMSDSADSDVQQNKRTKRQKSRGPIYTKEENAALVAAVSKEKVTLFCQSVPASEKSAAWERVRDSVNAVSKFHRPTNGVRHR